MSITSDYIVSTFGVTMAQARDFVMSHVPDPAYIYAMANQYHITSDMLGEIVGYSGAEVEGFFTAHGLDGTALHSSPIAPPPSVAPTLKLLTLEGSLLPDSIISFNTFTGALSTDALHAAIIAGGASTAAYDAMFSPSRFAGFEDGVFTPGELGSAKLGNIPATSASVQSVFFGTLITAVKNVDAQEAAAINDFGDANAAALAAGNPAIVQAAWNMFLNAISTPAAQSAASDSEVADFLALATTSVLQLIGTQPNVSPFQALHLS